MSQEESNSFENVDHIKAQILFENKYLHKQLDGMYVLSGLIWKKNKKGTITPYCLCRCSCGKEIEVNYHVLRYHGRLNCGDKTKHYTPRQDMTGYISGNIVVVKKNELNKKWVCKCSCGNMFESDKYNLKRIKCCPECSKKRNIERLRNIEPKNIIGVRKDKMVVVSEIPHKKYEQRRFDCLCDCGNHEIKNYSSIMYDRVKNLCCHECLYKSMSEDLTGQVFYRLTVTGLDEEFEKKRKRQTDRRWICKCECGSIVSVMQGHLKSGAVKSCGCISSFGEYKISNILSNKKIIYNREHVFKDLKGPNGGLLRFDFAIFENDVLKGVIEFQGIQHYDSNKEIFGKQQREETDKIKYEYCKKKGIPLFEIRYDEDIEVKLKEILDTLHVNPVPDAVQSAA